jgi:hypothetical protein
MVYRKNRSMGERNKKRSEKSSRIGKRSVLKGMGTMAGGLAFPYSAVSSAVGDEYDGEMVVRTPSLANSLSASEVRDIQRENIEAFKSNTESEIKIGGAYPEDDVDVVALVYRIDAAGQPSVYVGAVPSDQPVSKERVARLHRHANQHADRVRDEVDPKRADRDATSGVASAGYATGWDEMVADYAYEFDDCPYGGLYMGGEIYEKQGTSYFGYGIDHIHRANPGSNYCSSDWVLKKAASRHIWEKFDRDPPILHEYAPDTDEDGDYTVDASAGFSGASIGVSYDPPDTYRDVTAGPDGTENVIWDWDYSNNLDSAAQHNPTSVIKSAEEALSGTYGSNKLIKVEAEARWYKVWNNYETSSSGMTIYVE